MLLTPWLSSSHSSNPRLTSFETLIPNNRSVWMRKGFYGWAFALLVIDLILLIFVGPFMHWMSYLHVFVHFAFICVFWIYLYALLFVLILFLCFSFVWVKIQNHIKSEKFKKSDRICLSTYHMWVLPYTFVQMTLCIYEFSLFFMYLFLCGKNLEIYVWLL